MKTKTMDALQFIQYERAPNGEIKQVTSSLFIGTWEDFEKCVGKKLDEKVEFQIDGNDVLHMAEHLYHHVYRCSPAWILDWLYTMHRMYMQNHTVSLLAHRIKATIYEDGDIEYRYCSNPTETVTVNVAREIGERLQ